MDILVNTYPRYGRAANISADIWNYITILGVDEHIMLDQVMNEQSKVKALPQARKSTIEISYRRARMCRKLRICQIV